MPNVNFPIKEHAPAPFLHVEERDVLQQTLGDAPENYFQQATQFRSCTYYHPVFPDTKSPFLSPFQTYLAICSHNNFCLQNKAKLAYNGIHLTRQLTH